MESGGRTLTVEVALQDYECWMRRSTGAMLKPFVLISHFHTKVCKHRGRFKNINTTFMSVKE